MDLVFDELITETQTVWVVTFDGREVVLPRSECQLFLGDRVVTVPEWLAIKEELEGYAA